MQELLRKSAMEQFNAIKDKKVSATELTQASLDRIDSIDEKSKFCNRFLILSSLCAASCIQTLLGIALSE